MSKISVIGAGNVGATCVNSIATMEFAKEIVLLDIKEGLAEGKVMDIMQTAHLYDNFPKISGVTQDYEATKDSDIVVVTSGIPRKPGMTREELIGTNAKIVSSVVESALQYSPKAYLIIVSNPMDTMAYLTVKKFGLPKNRVIGMGGILDSSRFTYYLSEALQADPKEVKGWVIGGHGDTTMIPLSRLASYKGEMVEKLLDKEQIERVVSNTMVGGATLTKLLGTSAWYAPGASVAALAKAIVNDENRIYTCSVLLEGEYGRSNLNIGVPVVINKNGWERVIDFNLNEKEQELFDKSAEAVKTTNKVLWESAILK